MSDDDPRLSDEATGLPPLEEIEDASTLLVLAYAAGEGVVLSPVTGKVEPCRYLHLRGIAASPDVHNGVEWGQLHLAVPVEECMSVAAALAKGSTEDLSTAVPHDTEPDWPPQDGDTYLDREGHAWQPRVGSEGSLVLDLQGATIRGREPEEMRRIHGPFRLVYRNGAHR